MTNLSITQSYFLCALNSKGKFPSLSAEIPVCILAGGVLDLLLENNIMVQDKKLSPISVINSQYYYLQSLYDFIAERSGIKLDALASEYCFSISNKKMNHLTHEIGMSLVDKQCGTMKQSSVFGKKEMFIPHEAAVNNVVQMIRAEFLEDGTLSDEVLALTSLLEKSGLLKRYFSNYEKKQLKLRLDEVKNSSAHKIVAEIVDYIIVMIAVIASI